MKKGTRVTRRSLSQVWGQRYFFSLAGCRQDFIALSALRFWEVERPSSKHPITTDSLLKPNNAGSSLFLMFEK